MRICRIATVPFFMLHHLKEQIAATVRIGHEVILVSSHGPEMARMCELTGASFHTVPIARKIAPLQDMTSLIRIYLLFCRNRFDLVHSTTPKAGLLTAIAARLACIPIRLHTFTGQAWAERQGLVRWLAKVSDRLMIRLNTHCYADSVSQRDFLVAEGIARPEQITVFGQGSLAGVDLKRFNRARREAAVAVKAQLDIPETAQVIGFVGRVTKDKGIHELVDAFDRLVAMGCENTYLVLVGPLEPERDPLPCELLDRLNAHSRIRMVGYVPTPEDYVASFDIFCLPSYREGFGNVVLEAAAMGIPAVGTRIVGLIDAIIDQKTGLLVPPKNAEALAQSLFQLLNDKALRNAMGHAAEARVMETFNSDKVNTQVLAEYVRLAQIAPHGRCSA